jgi:hypothetical protein
VATIECGPGDWRILFNNSYTLGGSKAQSNQERQAHVPLLLHGSAKTVGLLGVATGSTVAGASLHPGIERIDAAELSPLVLQFARQHFEPYNRGVFRDPHVHFIQEDARWVVACQKQTYDVIIGDLFLPWRTGEGRLYTLEHFQAVRRALKPDGLFCQWLPMFQLTRPQFETIVRTFQQVFPEAFLVRGDFYTELPILGLIGGRSLSAIDWTKVRACCMALQKTGQITDPLVRHLEGVAMMVIGPLPASAQGPVNTLANSWLEWNAAENILGMRTPWFIAVPCAEYIRDIHRSGRVLMPEALQSSHDAGQFFLTLEIAAKMNLPVLSNLKSQIQGRLPKAMLQDAEANWQQWPMRIKPDTHSHL